MMLQFKCVTLLSAITFWTRNVFCINIEYKNENSIEIFNKRTKISSNNVVNKFQNLYNLIRIKRENFDNDFNLYSENDIKLLNSNYTIDSVDEEYSSNKINTNISYGTSINETCVGDPIYCNLTYNEYMQLLTNYIYPTTSEWILILSHCIVFCMGLTGNALVCLAVYTNYSMRTVTNVFIVNLAVADFFVILFCLPPTVVWDVTETWFMGETMCKVVLYFQTVSVTVSVLTLTFISVDRWYAICFPLRYHTKVSRAVVYIALIWIIALLSDIPEFLVLTAKKKQLRFGSNLFTQCETTWDMETEKKFYIGRFVMLYLLPLVLMSIMYWKIIRILWKSETIPGHGESRKNQNSCGYSRRNEVLHGNSSTMGQLRARRKAAKMLVAVVAIFASSYFPVHVFNIVRYTFKIEQSEVIAVLSLFFHWLCYANSAVNPLIYNFMSGKFRREFKYAFHKCKCKNSAIDRPSINGAQATSRINYFGNSGRSSYQLTSIKEVPLNIPQQTAQTNLIFSNENHPTEIIVKTAVKSSP